MSTNRTVRLATAAVATTLAAGVIATTTAPQTARAALPTKSTYSMLMGQTKTFGTVQLRVDLGNKLGEADLWETPVTVCNKGTEPLYVGPDTFSYTGGWQKGYMVTRMYSPRETYLGDPLANQMLSAGKCVTGSLSNTDHEPSGVSFHNLAANSRINVSGGMPGEAIIPFKAPRSEGTTGVHGDLTGDKQADVVGVSKGKLLTYRAYRVGGVPALATLGSPSTTGGYDWVGKAGDLDGNGMTDLLVRQTNGSMKIQLMMPRNRAGSWIYAGYDFNQYRNLTVLDDVNGDKRPELVGIDKAGNLQRMSVDAPRISAAAKIGANWGGVTQLLSVGDFSGDGRADLLAVTKRGDLIRYAMTSRGTVSTTTKVGHGWGGMATVLSPGDMNGDGRRDLVAVAKDGKLLLYPNLGAGRWGRPVQIGHGWGAISSLA